MPLDPLPHHHAASSEAQAREAQALRRAVTERLEQHRQRRSHGGTRHASAAAHAAAQHALPGIDSGTDADWTSGKPSRIADNVAARFAKSQSYRDFLQHEAETATRQAEAAAEIARRNADAVAAAQQQLIEEMLAWDERQFAPATQPPLAEPAQFAPPALPESGVLLPMPMAAEPTHQNPVLAPSEALRDTATISATASASASQGDATARTAAALHLEAPATTPPTPLHEIPTAAALPTSAAAALPAPTVAEVSIAPARFALPVDESPEPPTPIPANLIEFPRQLVAARKARPRLAEGPLREDADLAPERAQLRIFEVEASSFSTAPAAEPASTLPEWSSIHLDSWTAPHETAQPDAQVSLALPVYAAPLERRIMAATVDACCVGTAFLLAVAAAACAGDALPTGLFALGASAVTLLLFGIGYLLLSFTLTGQTMGMRYARIALCTFGDDNPTRSAMRRRLFAMALSAVSLGLGFAWALLDDDKLGWHDRISRMYQRAY